MDTRNAFLAGQTAMIIESTATLRGLIDSSQGKFELGTGFLPRPNEDAFKKSGTIIGGASVWILNGRPAAEQQCAWEFIKFISGAQQQAYWHTMSGYYPIRKAAYDEPLGQGLARQVPAVPDRHRPAPRRAEQPLHPGRPDRRLPDRPPDHRRRDRGGAGRQGHAAAGAGQGR